MLNILQLNYIIIYEITDRVHHIEIKKNVYLELIVLFCIAVFMA